LTRTFLRPTNSVKTLKVKLWSNHCNCNNNYRYDSEVMVRYDWQV